MSHEAAIVRLVDGRELAEKPQVFEDLDAALLYVLGTPVSVDGCRPWIRNMNQAVSTGFLMVGGKSHPKIQTKYVVKDEHTLGYLYTPPNWSSPLMSVLGSDVHGHSPLNGSVSVFGAKLRPANLSDFERFRVLTPPDFSPENSVAGVEVPAIRGDNC